MGLSPDLQPPEASYYHRSDVSSSGKSHDDVLTGSLEGVAGCLTSWRDDSELGELHELAAELFDLDDDGDDGFTSLLGCPLLPSSGDDQQAATAMAMAVDPWGLDRTAAAEAGPVAQRPKGKRHSSTPAAQRRAERAYRERKQARLLQLQATLAAATEQAERIARANAALRFKAIALEKFSRARRHVLDRAAADARGTSVDAALNAVLHSLGLGTMRTPAAAAAAAVGATTVAKGITCALQHIQMLGTAPVSPALVLPSQLQGGSVCAPHGAVAQFFPHDALAGLSEADAVRALVLCWRAITAQMMPLVMEAVLSGGRLRASSELRLAALATEMDAAATQLMEQLSPQTYLRLMMTSLDASDVAGCSSSSGGGGEEAVALTSTTQVNWHAVTAVAGFTADQMHEGAAAYQLLLDRLAPLMEERRALQAQLAAAMVACGGVAGGPMAAAAAAAVAADKHPYSADAPAAYMRGGAAGVRLEEVVVRLQRNLQAEGMERMMLESYCLDGSDNTPLQVAKVVVASYPYLPSLQGIFGAVHSEALSRGGGGGVSGGPSSLQCSAAGAAAHSWLAAPETALLAAGGRSNAYKA